MAVVAVAACGGSRPKEVVPSVPVASLPGHDKIAVDTAPKEELRLVPAEAYVRTYLTLFGGLAPLDVQRRARGADGAQLFDVWSDYLATLGFPDYKQDLPRGTQTNALMVSAYERLGAALCDRAVEHDLKLDPKTKTPMPMADRVVFAFEGSEAKDLAQFTPKFDVLHRTFLGYPAKLAPVADPATPGGAPPKNRTARFYDLFTHTVARHAAPSNAGPKSKLSPEEAGWAVVCEGLVRHPEFHLY